MDEIEIEELASECLEWIEVKDLEMNWSLALGNLLEDYWELAEMDLKLKQERLELKLMSMSRVEMDM